MAPPARRTNWLWAVVLPGLLLPVAFAPVLALAETTAAPSHKRGPKPKTPAASLPADAPLPAPSERGRRSIAGGPPADQLAQGVPDAELQELRAAEQVLFPEPLPGVTPGWSFPLPEAPRDSSSPSLGLPPVGSSARAVDVAPEDAEWLRSLTLPDLPVRLDRRVVTYLKFYRDSPRGRTIATIWAQKSGRYVAAIRAALRRAGLPTDLVWLSMIESGHDPTIRSPAGALGLWQFMPESARIYGLVVDQWVDERRDPVRSTQGAIRLLSDLFSRFGSWELALGAYNMGYAGMSRSISKYSTNDFWTLARLEGGLPWETTLYVPKVFALAIVMNNRQAFGLGKVQEEPAVAFDTVLVEPATRLESVARAGGVAEEDVARLNPEYLAGRVPPAAPSDSGRRFAVKVPKGAGERATRGLGSVARRSVIQVRLGDRTKTLSALYGVSPAQLAKENGLSEDVVLAPGTWLLAPLGAERAPRENPSGPLVVSRPAKPGPDERVVFYEVGAADDLAELARAFGVTAADIERDNAIDPGALLPSGLVLQVVVPKDRDLSLVRHFELGQLGPPPLVSGSPEFHDYFEGIKGKKRVLVIAKSGDTLELIGKRHGMSVGSMERVNQRSRSSALLPGETVVVYTEQEGGAAALVEGRAELPSLDVPRPDLLPGGLGTSRVGP